MLEQANLEINFCTNCSNYHGLFINIISRHPLIVWRSSFRIWYMEWIGTSTLKLGTNTLKNTYLLHGPNLWHSMVYGDGIWNGSALQHQNWARTLSWTHIFVMILPSGLLTFLGLVSNIHLLQHHWHLVPSASSTIYYIIIFPLWTEIWKINIFPTTKIDEILTQTRKMNLQLRNSWYYYFSSFIIHYRLI